MLGFAMSMLVKTLHRCVLRCEGFYWDCLIELDMSWFRAPLNDRIDLNHPQP